MTWPRTAPVPTNQPWPRIHPAPLAALLLAVLVLPQFVAAQTAPPPEIPLITTVLRDLVVWSVDNARGSEYLKKIELEKLKTKWVGKPLALTDFPVVPADIYILNKFKAAPHLVEPRFHHFVIPDGYATYVAAFPLSGESKSGSFAQLREALVGMTTSGLFATSSRRGADGWVNSVESFATCTSKPDMVVTLVDESKRLALLSSPQKISVRVRPLDFAMMSYTREPGGYCNFQVLLAIDERIRPIK